MKTRAVARKGDYTSLWSGTQFWPLDPRVEDIHLEDIARALSMQCRWGGHVKCFYSVAQHCVSVSEHCGLFPAYGLLHDAAEAYLVDVPTPIKKHLAGYYEIEARLLDVIGERFGIGDLSKLPDEVHAQDARALATEHRDLRTATSYWQPPAEPWSERIVAVGPATAEHLFLHRARMLGLT